MPRHHIYSTAMATCLFMTLSPIHAFRIAPLRKPTTSVHRHWTSLTSAFSPTTTSASRQHARNNRPFSRFIPLQASSVSTEKENGPVPVTLLSGFLGSGKTSALKNLLENRDGVRIGVIVNDVASVNIDAKLIANPSENANDDGEVMFDGGTVELQNGCACCSLADELLTSMQNLLDGRSFDAVVVELSGVADPLAVRSNWEQATLTNHPATKLADVNRVVTVVDACTFGTDWMTWNTAGERDGWVEEGDECSAVRKVPELLAEQVESADVLLMNKIDLAGEDQVKVASSVARGLNEKAPIFEVSFGKVSPKEILEMMGTTTTTTSPETTSTSVSGDAHSHDHENSPDSSACSDPTCDDPTHDHSHAHDHSCADPDCTDSSHSHSHDHVCDDPECDDPSHSHDHASNTSVDQLGIGSFVYKATIPFNSNRLMVLLNFWPVPIKEELDIGLMQEAAKSGYDMKDGKENGSPFVGVLRSKGFCWMAPTAWSGPIEDAWRHDTAMFWSHAGKHFSISTAGKWWGTISKEKMEGYFTNNMKEYERILREDWASDEFGDRRQELVFIGTNLDQKAIKSALDECLCTEEEMKLYRQQLRNFIETTFTAAATTAGGPSLFDTEGTDHLDV